MLREHFSESTYPGCGTPGSGPLRDSDLPNSDSLDFSSFLFPFSFFYHVAYTMVSYICAINFQASLGQAESAVDVR